MNIKQNVEELKQQISEIIKTRDIQNDITICAATKYVGIEEIKVLLSCDIFNIGENKVVDFLGKYDKLKEEKIIWHFIGSLQTNKVKKIINKIDFLHSLDRLSLAEEVNKHANRIIKCFVQVNCSGEASKHGMLQNDVLPFIISLSKFKQIQVIGLMTMAEQTEDKKTIRNTFKQLKHIQQMIIDLKLDYAPCLQLSMGMSHDYQIAIEEGSTVIRVGSRLFK